LIADGSRFSLVLSSDCLVAVTGRGMSFQITVLKVLAGHPEGRASLADLKHYVAVLSCSGPDWSQRMKRLAARAPELDIFTSGYVLRDLGGWQITEKGREFLVLIEAPPAEPAQPVALDPPIICDPVDYPSNVVPLHEIRRRRRAA
jgi:hypothetical protein